MDISEFLNIRYLKISFKLSFVQDTYFPKNKVSALRGGIGEVFMKKYCVEDRRCEACSKAPKCVAHNIMYSEFAIKPKFVTVGESIGYVITCEDLRNYFERGDGFCFELTLFGRNTDYLMNYVEALIELGSIGVSKNESKFIPQILLDGTYCDLTRQGVSQTDFYQKIKSYHEPQIIADYVKKKHSEVMSTTERVMLTNNSVNNDNELVIDFPTPLTIKYGGEILTEFNMDAIITAIMRRIYMLNCFEGNEMECPSGRIKSDYEIIQANVSSDGVRRYSSRKKQSMFLKGISGQIHIKSRVIDSDEIKLLLAAELTHIGKNTSFGFGRIVVNEEHIVNGS